MRGAAACERGSGEDPRTGRGLGSEYGGGHDYDA